MDDADVTVPHHVIAAHVFASDQFWAAADRLAAGAGHAEHPRQLLGQVEQTTRYTMRCVSCDQPIATFEVHREQGRGHDASPTR